jgi:hypothetical protein
MKMLLAVIAGSCAVVVLACGNTSPQSECNKETSVYCQKAYQCLTPLEIGVLGYESESDCETKVNAQNNCAAVTPCSNGQVYNGSAADQCLDNYQNATCGEIEGNSVDKTPCQQVCESADGG